MFKKLFAYFLLLNFLNTLFFPELQVWENKTGDLPELAANEPDEIDSMVEFVAEYWLDLGHDFSDADLDDQPENLKSPTPLKDYLIPGSLVFNAPVALLAVTPPFFQCRFPVSFFEIDSPPPKPGLV